MLSKIHSQSSLQRLSSFQCIHAPCKSIHNPVPTKFAQFIHLSVMHESTRELLVGFSLNLILENIMKNCHALNLRLDETVLMTTLHEDLHMFMHVSQS
jgi:hypothetical protein